MCSKERRIDVKVSDLGIDEGWVAAGGGTRREYGRHELGRPAAVRDPALEGRCQRLPRLNIAISLYFNLPPSCQEKQP